MVAPNNYSFSTLKINRTHAAHSNQATFRANRKTLLIHVEQKRMLLSIKIIPYKRNKYFQFFHSESK